MYFSIYNWNDFGKQAGRQKEINNSSINYSRKFCANNNCTDRSNTDNNFRSLISDMREACCCWELCIPLDWPINFYEVVCVVIDIYNNNIQLYNFIFVRISHFIYSLPLRVHFLSNSRLHAEKNRTKITISLSRTHLTLCIYTQTLCFHVKRKNSTHSRPLGNR